MRIAVITGASSGLGVEFLMETVKQFPELDEIWLIARRMDRLEKLSSMYSHPKCVPLPMDLSSEESYQELERLLNEKSAEVRLLINNAGFGKLGNLVNSELHSQMSMVDLNCRGLTAMTCVCLKHMSRGACIVNTCSIASFAPNPRLTVYSATKAYVLSFTKSLREELKPLGIGCTCVCPGPMKTEFLEVALITPGSSSTFDTLPYCDPAIVAKKTLIAARKGRCVYTNKFFYKLYRVIAKVVPHSLVMKISKA